MKLKSVLLTAVATISLATATIAQNVPSYVPTNGLVGWWPFNGNANDESGNGNNGTVNGASLTSDRFGNSNATFVFDGISNNITISNFNVSFSNGYTFSAWVRPTVLNYPDNNIVSIDAIAFGATHSSFGLSAGLCGGNGNHLFYRHRNSSQVLEKIGCEIPQNTWVHMVLTFNGTSLVSYFNGVQNDILSISNYTSPGNTLRIGYGINAFGTGFYFQGLIDDIGIWDRALSQQEVTDLYNSSSCSNDLVITPQTNTSHTGGNVSFTATTSDPNPSYIWQSDFGQDFQTLNNFGNYSGVNTNTLTINNLQLANHLQQIRAISTSGNCIDTSNVATITLTDTCINYITVTDTLIINTTLSVLSPPNNVNTIKVYPNPASTHITIDYGDYTIMNGYTLQIVNTLGQTLYTTPINQQSSYIDLTTWSGNGLYFVQIIDPQSNVIENRKIVLQ